MGHTGMDMGEMAEVMPVPKNSIPMRGGAGPFGDYIDMGGMFTVVKVRDRLQSYDRPWLVSAPPGTVALKASAAELARDGIDVRTPTARAEERMPQAQAPERGRRIGITRVLGGGVRKKMLCPS